MRAAELGRHGAIAGLCALAMSQGDSARRYYLASTAHYAGFYSRASYGAELGFVARVEELSKRTGRATVSATDLVSGETVMELSVGYIVLSEPMFERLYRGHRQPTEARARLASLNTARISPGLRSLAAVPTAPCAGHFDNYPALPLAIVLSELVEISSELIGIPCWVREARVEARDLCWAGQPARFESLLEGPSTLGVESGYQCRALSDATVCAEMRLILSPPPKLGS